MWYSSKILLPASLRHQRTTNQRAITNSSIACFTFPRPQLCASAIPAIETWKSSACVRISSRDTIGMIAKRGVTCERIRNDDELARRDIAMPLDRVADVRDS